MYTLTNRTDAALFQTAALHDGALAGENGAWGTEADARLVAAAIKRLAHHEHVTLTLDRRQVVTIAEGAVVAQRGCPHSDQNAR